MTRPESVLRFTFFPDDSLKPTAPSVEAEALAKEACQQVEAYLLGRLQRFDLPLEPEGTDFQKAVWQGMCEIAYGDTLTYGELAQQIGATTGTSQAIGLACGANPIALIIPCHRVVASGGNLGGFGGGLPRKRWLLHLEKIGQPPRALEVERDLEGEEKAEQTAFDFG